MDIGDMDTGDMDIWIYGDTGDIDIWKYWRYGDMDTRESTTSDVKCHLGKVKKKYQNVVFFQLGGVGYHHKTTSQIYGPIWKMLLHCSAL